MFLEFTTQIKYDTKLFSDSFHDKVIFINIGVEYSTIAECI